MTTLLATEVMVIIPLPWSPAEGSPYQYFETHPSHLPLLRFAVRETAQKKTIHLPPKRIHPVREPQNHLKITKPANRVVRMNSCSCERGPFLCTCVSLGLRTLRSIRPGSKPVSRSRRWDARFWVGATKDPMFNAECW